MAGIDSSLLAGFSGHIKMETLISLSSACLTGYLWLVKMRRETAGLKLYQPAAFRADRRQCSREPGKEKATWYGDIFIANPSSLPRTVIRSRIELLWKGQWIEGKWILEKKDDLPWAVEPLRVLTRGLGLSFDVDEGTPAEELQANHRIRLTLVTLDGRKLVQQIETCGPSAVSARAA
jgi:hypothetical protein